MKSQSAVIAAMLAVAVIAFVFYAPSLGFGFFNDDPTVQAPLARERQEVLLEHLHALYAFYGEFAGVRIGRKHIGWYVKHLPGIDSDLLQRIYAAENPDRQIALAQQLFDLVPKELAA